MTYTLMCVWGGSAHLDYALKEGVNIRLAVFGSMPLLVC